MKNLTLWVGLAAMVLLLGACSAYNGAAVYKGKLYLAKTTFVMGIGVPSVDVCDIDGSNCQAAQQ